MSQDGAALLRDIAQAGQSFLVFALPQNAGKTTLARAVLAEAPSDVPQEEFFGTEQEARALAANPGRGYLVVGEIGHRGRPGYLAGEEVVRLFELASRGYAVASSLHADSVEEVFEVLERNGIDPVSAATVRYLIKVRVLGDPRSPATPRVVEAIHEVSLSDGLKPTTRVRYYSDAA